MFHGCKSWEYFPCISSKLSLRSHRHNSSSKIVIDILGEPFTRPKFSCRRSCVWVICGRLFFAQVYNRGNPKKLQVSPSKNSPPGLEEGEAILTGGRRCWLRAWWRKTLKCEARENMSVFEKRQICVGSTVLHSIQYVVYGCRFHAWRAPNVVAQDSSSSITSPFLDSTRPLIGREILQAIPTYSSTAS